MKRVRPVRWLVALGLGIACQAPSPSVTSSARLPDVVIVFVDDLGYGDLSCYGHPTIATPRIDALAEAGMRLTEFYVASPVCSPSRAALLTGCYPKRVGMHEHVVFPETERGLHRSEVTLAEILRERGYATGCFGKWHLGHRPGMLPTDQGFDTWFGIPYSNDMAQYGRPEKNNYAFHLPLLRDETVLEWEPDQRLLTRRVTDEAIAFMREQDRADPERPFFVYVPHPMPHVPLAVPEERAGRSRRGLYGDVVEELDWSVGALVDALDELGRLDDTLIVFTSDNGPWLPMKLRGGSAGLLRGGKGTNFEGGQRVPCIVHWPRRVPSNAVCRELVTAMDWLPTIAAWTEAELDPQRAIDGRDVRALLAMEEGAGSPTESFVHYTSKGALAGIRRGPWKLLLARGDRADRLFHLDRDPSERFDVASEEPALVAELRALAIERDRAIEAGARSAAFSDLQLFEPRR